MPKFSTSYVFPRDSETSMCSLDAYRRTGGYDAFERSLHKQTPEQLIQLVTDAQLRGRGGAGYLAGEKWRTVSQHGDAHPYVICNAYDADSRSLAARALLASNPHQIIEGILLAAYAVGASEAYLFTRSLYNEGIAVMEQALHEAEAANLLGYHIAGNAFSCKINIVAADIGFIGGEETVQIAMIKGRRGMPEQRPSYPAQHGLWDKPTVIHSVETLANVPTIVREGPIAFRQLGTAASAGTKVITFYDSIHKSEPTIVEVPFGISLREILHHAGYSYPDSEIGAVVVGGEEGGALPPSMLDLAFDYKTLADAGAIVGSGIIELLAVDTCMVAWAMKQSQYLSKESCGKCIPCRLGVKRMAGTLEGIVSDLGTQTDLSLLEELADYVPNGSLCGFGIHAPNPFKTAKRYWPDHFTQHIEEQRCPTGTCIPVRTHRFVKKHVLP